ncbi:MAG: hypothetical protein P1V51_04455 [Deltaproteobacteria bacterium]|nr:hypothetical protein [Deltaproteobacteria bacterium]
MRVRPDGERLPEAFFEDELPRSGGRSWVLPLGPIVLLWAVATLIQQGELGLEATEVGQPVFGAVAAPDAPPRQVELGGGRSVRRLRLAQALLARDEPDRARTLLLQLRRELGDVALVLRPLARAEKALGHRERAADLYVTLLQSRGDDIEALEFFLRYRYEEDDLQGALDIAGELRELGALTGESAHFADLVRAEQAARAMARRMRAER